MGWQDDQVVAAPGARAAPTGGGWQSDAKAAPRVNETSAPEAGALGFSQGATLGFGDEIAGGVNAALQKAGAYGATDPNKSFLGLYRENRDYARKLNATAAEEHPVANMAGNVAGGIGVSAGIPGGGGYASAAKLGALLGAVNGLGSSNADVTQGDIAGAAKDTSIAAGLGAGAGILGHGVGQAIEGGAGALKDFARKQALASVKGTAGDYAKILGKGQVDELGDFLLKPQEALGGDAPVGILNNQEAIGDKLAASKAAAGAHYATFLPELDAAGQAANVSAIDHQGITRNIVGLIQEAQAGGPKMGPVVDALNDDLTRFISDVPAQASFSEAEAIKQGYWSAAKKALAKLPRDRTAQDDVNIALGGIVKDAIDQQAEKAAQAVAQPDLAKSFIAAKRAYGSSSQLADIAGRGEGRAFARNLASPSDKLAGAMEAANARAAGAGGIESGLKGMAASLINNQIRRRAASTLAVAADSASTKLQRIVMTSPGKLGAYGGILSRALTDGGQNAFNAHAFVLGQTDPKFQERMQKMASEKDDD